MSLNHIIKSNGIDTNQIIDIACKNLNPVGNLIITCDDGSKFNLKPPVLGTASQVLKSDGNGNTFWGNDTATSSGVDYQGANPVAVGTHVKISNTLGTELINSKLVESSTELNITSLDIINAGKYNSTTINNGSIESLSSTIDLIPSSGNRINLHSVISAEDNKIVNCADPTDINDVANKNYVDNLTSLNISYNGSYPTIIGEMTKFNSTNASTITKSSLIENGTNLNMGNLDIVNVGLVDSVDILTLKTSYDNNVNQNVKNTGNPTFTSVTTNLINEPSVGQGTQINTTLINNGTISGGNTNNSNLTLNSNSTASKGSIICLDELNISSNKIINVGVPTLNTDATNKLYVDGLISSIPVQVYDIIIPLTAEDGFVNSTGIKATFHMPRTINCSLIKASLTTVQTSGSNITINPTNNGNNILSVASSLTISNGSQYSNQPSLNITTFTALDRIAFDITGVGDGTAVGLKVEILGTVA
jgi:hypothetical protein